MRDKFLISLFVDNVFLHKYWKCHCLAERSFFIAGRQFHICARCTGIFTGYIFSVLLLPLRRYTLFLFPLFLLIILLDGGTQFLNFRESNNMLRFSSGLGFGLTLLPFLIITGESIYGRI
ncbi:MAG: DUF2085 domain-containing protein [Synergistaceae bacterium]|nr:DUF2085 domain-containing protein [Synergistaceae bacterium]